MSDTDDILSAFREFYPFAYCSWSWTFLFVPNNATATEASLETLVKKEFVLDDTTETNVVFKSF